MNKTVFTIRKAVVALTFILIGSFSAFSVTYRGFVDLGGGYTFGKYDGGGIQLNTTHGVQWHGLFTGIGVGGTLNLISAPDYEDGAIVSIPVYVNARYDFFNTAKTNFFVSLKLGYSIGVKVGDHDGWQQIGTERIPFTQNEYGDSDYYKILAAGGGGFYYQPTVGVRFKINNHRGISLGVTLYNQSIDFKKVSGNYEENLHEKFSKMFNTVGVILGFDF